jgi:hypothetical protein
MPVVPDDLTTINADRINRLRSNLLTKAEVLMAAIKLDPEDEDDHMANVAASETIYNLVQSFVELR